MHHGMLPGCWALQAGLAPIYRMHQLAARLALLHALLLPTSKCSRDPDVTVSVSVHPGALSRVGHAQHC